MKNRNVNEKYICFGQDEKVSKDDLQKILKVFTKKGKLKKSVKTYIKYFQV